MDQISASVTPELSLLDVTELKPENYIDLWRSATNEQHHFGQEQVNIASMISYIFVGQEMFDLFEKCLQELDQEKLTKLKENEQFLRALIQLKMHKKAFKDIFTLIWEAEFKNPEGLVDIWDEAHYREKEETMKQPLTALERFRIRKKNPPPVNICPSGRQLKTITDQARATLKRWYEKHISDPYPSKLKKQKLAEKSGLTLNQVKTWFSNARRNRRKKRQLKKTDTNPKQLPKSKSHSTGRSKADCSSGTTEWKVYELLVDKNMDNAAVIANPSKLISVDSEPVKLEVFDCSGMCIQKSVEVLVAGKSSQETECTASEPDTTPHIKEYGRTDAEEVKDNKDQIACGLFVLQDSEEDNTSSENVDQSIIPENKSMVTKTKNSLASDKFPQQEIKISNSRNNPDEQHMYMNNHFEISLPNDLEEKSTDAHRAEQMTERIDNENYLTTKPVEFVQFDKQRETEQTTEYSEKEIKPESDRQCSIIRADNEQSNKPERHGFQLERKRCTSTEPYNQACKIYPDSSDPDFSPISVDKGATVGLRSRTDENFTEFDKEMNAATPENIKIHNKKPQVSINSSIQTLLKRKLTQKYLTQTHHSCSQQNGENNEIIPHRENITIRGRDSVDMSYNSFESLMALSELCNSIDQDDFSHHNTSQPSVPYRSRAKHQNSKKSEKLRTAWIESLASSRAMNCSLGRVETRHSLSKIYKPLQLNVGLNQDAESSSEQRYPPVGLHQTIEDPYIPADEHPYYPSNSQRNYLKLLSPRIADDAETDRHATDFYTPSDYRQTTSEGSNQSLPVGQSGISEQNIPYTSGLWQCRPLHSDLVVVPSYQAQPFTSGCHGNSFSGHSHCCDIPQNIQQASVFSESQHGHISVRANSEYDYSQDAQYHWSSQESVSKNSVDDAVQGLLNLSSQESDF